MLVFATILMLGAGSTVVINFTLKLKDAPPRWDHLIFDLRFHLSCLYMPCIILYYFLTKSILNAILSNGTDILDQAFTVFIGIEVAFGFIVLTGLTLLTIETARDRLYPEKPHGKGKTQDRDRGITIFRKMA